MNLRLFVFPSLGSRLRWCALCVFYCHHEAKQGRKITDSATTTRQTNAIKLLNVCIAKLQVYKEWRKQIRLVVSIGISFCHEWLLDSLFCAVASLEVLDEKWGAIGSENQKQFFSRRRFLWTQKELVISHRERSHHIRTKFVAFMFSVFLKNWNTNRSFL